MHLRGAACVIAAAASAWGAWLVRADLTMLILLLAGVWFFAAGAYASFFSPSNWSDFAWGTKQSDSSATAPAQRGLAFYMQTKGIVLGSWLYLAGLVIFGGSLLVGAELIIAVIFGAPFGVLGLVTHTWTFLLRWRARDQSH